MMKSTGQNYAALHICPFSAKPKCPTHDYTRQIVCVSKQEEIWTLICYL